MITNNPDSTESIVEFIIEKFQKFPDEKDITNVISKFDILINKTLNSNDIVQLKKLIKYFFENKIDNLNNNSNLEKKEKSYEEYSFQLINKIKELQKKVQNLENENIQIKFEMNKKSEEINSLKIILNKSQEENKNLIESRASLHSNITEVKTNLISEITDLKIKVSNLIVSKTELNKNNCKLESDIKELKLKNIELEGVKKK